MNIVDIVMVVIVPVVVSGLKKLKLPSKWAPIAATAVALALVAVGKVIGLDLDVNSIADAIIKGLAIAGVSVLGYDAITELTEKK